MSGKKSYNGTSDTPSWSRKMVQSLKEIVTCPDAEIYAVLKDCNMDPNEAVNRLLSQDPFHEVKSKKEKKKESCSDNFNQKLSVPICTSVFKIGIYRIPGHEAIVTVTTVGLEVVLIVMLEDLEEVELHLSALVRLGGSHEKLQTRERARSRLMQLLFLLHLENRATIRCHTAAGQMSMADIVKMGRPHNKITNSQKNHEHDIAANQHVPVKDQWPSIEKLTAASTASVSVEPTEPEICNGPADYQSSRGGDRQLKDQLEVTQRADNGPFGNLGRDQVQADTVAGGVVPEDESGVSSEFDDNPYRHEMQNHPVEHQRDEDNVSSVAVNLQELSVENHDKYSSHDEDRLAVVIPDHLLVYTEECSQLSFGSFGARHLNNNLEEASNVAPQIEDSDARHALITDFPLLNSF
ncbi:unnamed protein product [Eruca vesicaria subsp. sativa]|uniref:GBF-interacting protein 1 N-terminal domain-containing protein n=1 Tax=Eruca vesicaria subsp. sativa TaxID=29727 RepID=A0ABC8L6J8_ERUVS|nr:unnamed protein product [Eruca vesicaria subsp. sativa]